MLDTRFEGPLAMLGDQIARFSGKDLAAVLKRSKRGKELIKRFNPDSSANMTMGEYMSVFGVQQYSDIDLCGNPKIRLDLSMPIPKEYQRVFRTVADIGTLEHIINPWQALLNISEMLMEGGKLFLMVPCKINLDHGYYTISPQLLGDFFLNNGFKVLKMELLSYFGSYDSRRCFTFRTNYKDDNWKLHRRGRDLPLSTRIERRLRCLIADYAFGTINLFVAEKVVQMTQYKTNVQIQHIH